MRVGTVAQVAPASLRILAFLVFVVIVPGVVVAGTARQVARVMETILVWMGYAIIQDRLLSSWVLEVRSQGIIGSWLVLKYCVACAIFCNVFSILKTKL